MAAYSSVLHPGVLHPRNYCLGTVVDGGIDDAAVEDGLALRFRQGGEEFCPAGRHRTHKLKKLLQEDGVVPWMRQRIPLLYAGDRLVAVGDLWVAAEASKTNGYGIHWRNRPALH